jgi:hypothetical protein
MGSGSIKLYLDPTLVGASHRLAQHGGAKGAKAKPGPVFVDLAVNMADRSDANSNWDPISDVGSKSVDVRNATAYVSDPLTKPLELQGAWSGRLDVTVNKMDVDLRIAAYELLQSGDYVQLFDPYVLRASYAYGLGSASPCPSRSSA